MLPHYLVNVFGTRNCHVNEMSEKKIWRESSNCHVIFNHLKIVVEKVLSGVRICR